MNAIILIIILIALIIHRYLSSYWEQGLLPCGAGFTIFANLLAVTYLFNFIWQFGILIGIILAILCFFQIIYSSFLWPFLLPWLKSTYKKNEFPPVNPYAYGIWSYMIIGLLILTIINLFITDFKSVQHWFEINIYQSKIIFSAIILLTLIGNLLRITIMKSLLNYNATILGNDNFMNTDKDNSEFIMLYKRSQTALKEHDYKSAKKYIDKAVFINNKSKDALYLRAVILNRLNNKKMALEDLKKAAKLGHPKAMAYFDKQKTV